MKYLRVLLFLISIITVNAQDVPINPNLSWNGESSLAINPVDSNNLVTAWMKLTGIGRVSIAVSSSFDGGQTWSVPVNMPHFFVNSTSADPTLCFRNDGILFLGYIDYLLTHDSGAVYVAQSSSGGLTWYSPVEAINGFATPDLPVDRPWITIDNSNTSSQGKIHVITKSIKDAPFPHAVWHIESSDSGATWSAPELVDDSIPIGPSISSMGIPAVSSDGTLHVLYLSYNPSQSLLPRYILASKTNSASGFTYKIVNTLPLNSFISPGDSLYQYSYHLATNPVDSNNLVIIWTDNRNGDPDIYSASTFDEGISWSLPLRINDDSISNGVGQDMCWAGFSANGRYAAAWRDRREAGIGQNADYKIYAVRSDDGGNSFSASDALSSQSGPLYIPVDGNDFLGVALSSSKVFSSWADKRNSRNQIYLNSLFLNSITTGIQDQNIESELFIVHPNPVHGEITININCYDLQDVFVYDLFGKPVKHLSADELKTSSPKCKIDLKSLKPGIYAASFVSGRSKKRIVKKIVVF